MYVADKRYADMVYSAKFGGWPKKLVIWMQQFYTGEYRLT